MVIDELYWFILIFWVIFLLVGFKWNNLLFKGTSGMIGLFFGLLLMTGVNLWMGLITLFVGLGIFFDMALSPPKEEKKE